MRKALIAAVLSAAFVVSANAKEQRGAIVSVDEAGKTFICHWGANDWTYKTTDKTAFRVRGKNGGDSRLRRPARCSHGAAEMKEPRSFQWPGLSLLKR